MSLKASQRFKKSEGFTLIELLVVVIIIGILASIAVIGISGARKSAYAGQCTANASQLVKAIVAYKAANNLYPGETTLVPFTTDKTFSNADILILTTAGASYLSAAIPYVSGAVISPYYLQASLTFATGAIKVTTSPTYAGCPDAIIN